MTDLANIQSAVDGIKSLLPQAREVAEQAAAEAKAAGQAAADTQQKQAAMQQDLSQMLGMITDMQRKAALIQPVQGMIEQVEPHVKSAFRKLLAKGDGARLDDNEVKALSVLSSPDGGYLVPRDTSGRLIAKIQDSSPVRRYAAVQAISGDALEGLYDNGEADSGWVGEKQARPNTNTSQLGKYRIQAHEMYAAPLITQQLLDDAAIDVEGWLIGKLTQRFARAESEAFVTGDGVGKPKGLLAETFVTTSDKTRAWNNVQKVKTGVSGAFAAAPNSGDALIRLVTALHSQFRQNAIFAMNSFTLGEVMLLKDSDGRYLWSSDFTAGAAGTILGQRVDASFDHMPDISAGSLSIIFGDIGQAYQIVYRNGIRITPDPYTQKPFVEMYATKRVGGQVVNFEAYKALAFEV
jgi:HK97 family phage major capsid protein